MCIHVKPYTDRVATDLVCKYTNHTTQGRDLSDRSLEWIFLVLGASAARSVLCEQSVQTLMGKGEALDTELGDLVLPKV